MYYTIQITHDNLQTGYVGIVHKKFISISPNRSCVLWVNTLKKAERIMSIMKKRYNPKRIEIQTFERILR